MEKKKLIEYASNMGHCIDDLEFIAMDNQTIFKLYVSYVSKRRKSYGVLFQITIQKDVLDLGAKMRWPDDTVTKEVKTYIKKFQECFIEEILRSCMPDLYLSTLYIPVRKYALSK